MNRRRKAAIIGGGVIGGGWAARFLLMGWDVAVHDPDPEAERKLTAVLENARRALPMLYDVALPPEGQLTFAADIGAAVEGAEWVQESVPERLELKHRVLAAIQAGAPAGAVIASSTSGFRPSQLQEGAARPAEIIVAHPFNPVYLLPLVELVGSVKNDQEHIERAAETVSEIGMYPLRVRAEIDAHIADRFLEAVWREALWLVRDDVARTEEIDDAIRYGFGLRWAQMGLFETYRVAGGEAGMRHFLAQFGPALKWPWTRLTDVPDLDPDLVEKIAAQSDSQAGTRSIADLERQRDDNLVMILRALRHNDAAAGALLNAHQQRIAPPVELADPLVTVRRVVPIEWTDYNGHMNEGRYGQVFSDAADYVMALVGADADYIAGGMSYFTVETNVKFLAETLAGEMIHVISEVVLGEGKKLRLHHRMLVGDSLRATCEQMLVHVSLQTRRSAMPTPEVQARVEALARAHAGRDREA